MKRKTLFIIDDDPKIMDSIKLFFPQFRYIYSSTGKNAVNYLHHPEIDLIILDYELPDMSGLALLQHFREHHWHIGIIILTAHTQKSLLIDFLEHDADSYVNKPISAEILGKKIDLVLNKTYRIQPKHQSIEAHINHILFQINKENHSRFKLTDFCSKYSLDFKKTSRVFKRTVGQSFLNYQITQKMKKAIQLLETTHLTIQQISEICGYLNPSSFMKIFKKSHNKTPSEYRRYNLLSSL